MVVGFLRFLHVDPRRRHRIAASIADLLWNSLANAG
jgi:hypothetical protein